MVKRLMFLLAVPLIVFGGNLTLENGLIQAHTEVFADASIDPSVSNIQADLSMQDNNIESLKGFLAFNIVDFKSTNSGRDEHMQEMFALKKYPNISLTIDNIAKKSNIYVIDGVMHMHGVKKPVELNSTITQKSGKITIQSNFSVKVTDYGMEPPSLLFFTVRDRVDINASLTLKAE